MTTENSGDNLGVLYADLKNEMSAFRSDIQQQKENKSMKQAAQAYRRPPLSEKTQEDDLHRKAIDAYVRRGDEAELRDAGFEGKGMSSSVNAEGGFLVDPQTAQTIDNTLTTASSLRSVANVVQVEAGAYDVLVDDDGFDAGWASESAPSSETSTPYFARISIPLNELSALPKCSQRLLDDAAFDIETWLAQKIASRFSRSESAAFISGDGFDKPKGILAHSMVENESWMWGSLGYVKTGAAGDFASSSPADAIVDLVYALPAEYRHNATFVMNSKTAGAVRKMKDADGRFLWTDSLASGEPAKLMGYSVLICEAMPDIGEGEKAIAFGDFHNGYTIAERPDMRILRDPFSAKPHVLFYATKRVGGDVTDFAAIKFLSFEA